MTFLAVLAESAIRAVVFAALAAGTLAAFRVTRPMVRLSVWTIVLTAALAMPALGHLVPAWRVPVAGVPLAWLSPTAEAENHKPFGPDVQASTSKALTFGVAPQDARLATDDSTLTARGAKPAPPLLNLSRIAIALYLIGMFALAFRMGLGWIASRRLERGARLIDDVNAVARLGRIASAAGLRHSPRLLQSTRLFVPMTMSVTRPTVVLPDTWRGWDDGVLQAVLTHEVSHVARLDTLTQRLSLLYRTIYWFSPLAWWLPRQLGDLAEQASDEAVLRAGTSPPQYARMLLEFFRAVPQTGHRADWHLAMASGAATSCEARVERILAWRGGQAMRLTKAAILGIVLAAITGVSVAASVRPSAIARDQAAPRQVQPPSTTVAVPMQSERLDAASSATPLSKSLPIKSGFGSGFGVRLATQAPTQSGVAGTWVVSMVNRAEPFSLNLKVDGQNVTGQFSGSAIVGEFRDGTLTFGSAESFAAWRNGTIGDDNSPQMYPGITSASVKPDGSLTGWSDVYIRGYGPQPIKRTTWTAVRTTLVVSNAADAQLPAGDWSFSHRPYLRTGADALPVRVMSVKGEASRLQITAETIKNQSGKTVSELRLSWYLTREDEPNRILRSGTTPTVFPLNIPSGASLRAGVPVIAFVDVYEPLAVAGRLSGRFVLEVAVTEARYSDGTSWKAEGLPTNIRLAGPHSTPDPVGQSKPDFTGNRALGLGHTDLWGTEYTATLSDRTLTIVRTGERGPSTYVFNLDGSVSTFVASIGNESVEQAGTATWDDSTLVLTTKYRVRGSDVEAAQTWSIGPAGKLTIGLATCRVA